MLEELSRERIKRLDEVYPVFLALSSILLTLVDRSPGLLQFSYLSLVVLVAFSMLAWGIGHVRGDDSVGASFKLAGWLAWVNQIGILVIFSAWIDYLHFIQAWEGIMEWTSLVRLLTGVALVLVTVLTWFLMVPLYRRERSECVKPLAVGVLISLLVVRFLIY
jgi:hypothetical protein